MWDIALISEHASPLASLGGVDSGGQNVYVGQLAKHLAQMGHYVDVFTRQDQADLPPIAPWSRGVRIVHVPAGPPRPIPKEQLLPYMGAFSAFMLQFCQGRGRKYDLIHANFFMSAQVGAELKRALDIPLVVTFHALGRVRLQHQKSDGFPLERLAIEDRVIREADGIVAECPQDREDMIRLYRADPERIQIIPCGFDPDELGPVHKKQARVTLGLRPDEWILLQLGRMVPRKGVDTVVRGLAQLSRHHGIKARLLLVGGDSRIPDFQGNKELARLRAIAIEEGVSDSVQFVGSRGRQELKDYYSAADVFVTTPWYEPFGITPVEAMACGTPVIGSTVGGIKFTVRDGETGFLIRPHDADELAGKLAYLFRHPQVLRSFSIRAVRRANALFTWKEVAKDVADFYESIMTPSRFAESIIAPTESALSSAQLLSKDAAHA